MRYEIDLKLLTPHETPSQMTSATTFSSSIDVSAEHRFFHIKAEFHHALLPIRIAKLLPRNRLYRRTSLTEPRSDGEHFGSALSTIRSLLADMHLALPEEVVFGAAKKLQYVCFLLACDPAPSLALRLRITASFGAASSEMAEWHKLMVETVPASSAAIERLERVCNVISATEDREICSLCYEKFPNHPTTTFVRMPCSHIYHKDCITKWLGKSHKCPSCDYLMPTGDC